MSLESRAAQATRSLRASVAGRAPVGIPVVARRQRRSLVTSFGATAAAVLFVFGIASAMPSFFEPDQVGGGTSVPEHDGSPLVVEPDDHEGDGALVEIDEPFNQIPVRQYNSESDSPRPWTKFYGDTDPGTIVTATSEYGSAVMTVGEHGEFSLKLLFGILPPPGEEFPILVTLGSEAYEFHFTSWFDPTNVEITAHQTYGFSDDPEAFEKFFGSAPAGAAVIATSQYGNAETTADKEGQWRLKLWFSELPHDEEFEILVDVAGTNFVFTFVSLFEKPQHPLSITQVNTSSESSSPYVQFIGTGPTGTGLLAQSAYGSEDLVIGESGEFSLKLWFSSLPPAGEKFWITLKVDGETYGTFPFTSHYQKPVKKDPPPAELSVSQYNTESDGAEPWVKFRITGPKGTQVDILSDYGSKSQTLSSTDEYVKLWFSTLPPAGVQFPITVKINGEVWGTYPFTSWFDPASIELSVTQYNTESWDASPWAKFIVTGPVGTQVQILSDYGSTSQTLSSFEEYVKLWFSTLPPAGVQFPITVKINGEVWGTYQFTSWHEETPVPITANATYGSCSEDPPYDIYFGTAPAGTSVTISSPYGSDSTTADGAGNWSKKVFFSGAPLNEPFTVTVTVGADVFSFGMVVTG